MGLNYSFTLGAESNIPAATLLAFLKAVEVESKGMGFNPTMVFEAKFDTKDERTFARRIGVLVPVTDTKLQGVALPDPKQYLDYDTESGRCRILPESAVVLVVTNEHGMETVFAFCRYPETLNDINGNALVKVPVGGRWHFSGVIQSPDLRYRSIVKQFASGGYAKAERDDFYPKA